VDLREAWNKAVNRTEILRWRKASLDTFGHTTLNYAFLAESAVNAGDTVHRKGKILVHKPMLLLPENIPQFEGFDAAKDLGVDENELARFLLVRGVSFPSLKFRNETDSLNVMEKPLNKAVESVMNTLDHERNFDTGVLVGPEDCWQLSIIIYAGGLMTRSASKDIRRLLED
jgi:hypothetical protein